MEAKDEDKLLTNVLQYLRDHEADTGINFTDAQHKTTLNKSDFLELVEILRGDGFVKKDELKISFFGKLFNNSGAYVQRAKDADASRQELLRIQGEQKAQSGRLEDLQIQITKLTFWAVVGALGLLLWDFLKWVIEKGFDLFF